MRRIWAVAVNTVRQALRMKVAIIFMVLLGILLPAMGAKASGDGTLKGQLQTFVSYGLSLTSLLLCLLTIIVSIYTLTSDISQRQIYTVITKPIRRFELLLGKLLGVILLDAGLLVIFSMVIYGIAVYMPVLRGADEAEVYTAANEFLTARKALVPQEPDVTKEVEERYAQLQRMHQLDEVFEGMSRSQIIAQLTNQLKLGKRAAEVGREIIWEFENVKPRDANGTMFVRFKYDVSVTPPDEQVYGRWIVGDYRLVKYGTPINTPVYPLDHKDPMRKFREIEVPADAVAKDGYLAVGFVNLPLNNTTVIFPLEDGLEVLYKADSFTGNFVRAVLLILFRLIFLACLGIFAATFLSFPVAILLCVVVFFTASFSGFVTESFKYLGENIGLVYSYSIKLVVWLLPQFDKFNPTKFLVSARLLSWSFLGNVMLSLVFIKAVILLLAGLLIFRFREIAKTIV